MIQSQSSNLLLEDTARLDYLQQLGTLLPTDIPFTVEATAEHLTIMVSADRLADVCLALMQPCALQWLSLFAVEREDQFQVITLWYDQQHALDLQIVGKVGADRRFQSLTPHLPLANWYEREAQDLYGLQAFGHPDPRPLVNHAHWPQDQHPHLHAYDREHQPDFVPYHLPASQPKKQGEHFVQIPVGPIHAGIIEPGHFLFDIAGEQIHHLAAHLFYTHRGVEKQLAGMKLSRAMMVIERNCAVCTVSASMAFAQAVEQAAQSVIPARARFLRSIYGELERLYNHIGDIGNICAGIGFHAAIHDGAWLKEQLLQLNEQLSGSRYLFGLIIPGGVRRDLTPTHVAELKASLQQLQPAWEALFALILNNSWVLDRLQGTGRVLEEDARRLGAVGIAARASHVERDVRRDRPYAAYSDIPLSTVPVLTSGDVHARLLVRMEEVRVSYALLEQLLAALPEGEIRVTLGTIAEGAIGVGVTESPRGEYCQWVQFGPGNTLARAHIRSASYPNWPVVAHSATGNMIPDFPLINKSFELCYSCLDR